MQTWGQDEFDLADALDKDPAPTQKPPKKPGGTWDDLNLEDGLGGNHDPPEPPKPRPNPNPNPNKPDTNYGGGFSDNELDDGHGGGGGGGNPGGRRKEGDDEAQGESPGVISGIVAAAVAALAGAVSSFIAYQKKKWCFKENADQSEVNMQTQYRTNAEPPVQQTLLQT